MPLLWPTAPSLEFLDLPKASARPVAQQAATQDQRVTVTIDKDLTVKAQSVQYDPETSVYTFSSGVEATYGLTTVKADHLEVRMAESTAHAMGKVQVLDPDAYLSADDLEFSWLPANRWAKAKNIRIEIGHAHIKAESASLKPLLWEFTGVEATNCPEYYWIRSRRVVMIPGESGKIENPTLYAFGHRLLNLPDRHFNLNPRTQGVGLPALSIRTGQGIGIAWDAGLLLNPQTNLYMSAGVFPGSYPSLGVTATRSFVPSERANAIITPGSELSERFRFGYLDNIEVRRLGDEPRFFRTPRNSISVDSLWNQGVSGRDYDTVVSKAIEGVYEVGGVVGARTVKRTNASGHEETVSEGGVGFLAQARLQTIRERGNPFTTRGVLIGSAELPELSFGRDLKSLARIDTTNFLGSQRYGWVRGLAGLSFSPNPQVTLSGGVYGSKQFGTPQFRFDRLVGDRGVELRADLDLGPTKVSYLTKYDVNLGWYDREYMISQITGCFEPFLVYRKFPQTYTLGVRLRLDEFYDILSKRNLRRESGAKTVISAPHEHPR